MALQQPKKLVADLAASRYKPDPTPVDRVFDDSVERAMFDEILNSNRGVRPISRGQQRSDDTDFNLAITKRLRASEQEISSLRQHYARLQSYTDTLKSENAELKRQIKNQDTIEENLDLARENSLLAEQIREMEQFLLDYGLQWVGRNNRSISTNDAGIADLEPTETYSQFAKKVEELNNLIKSEPIQVKTTDQGGMQKRGRLVHASETVNSIKMTFYKNGLMIKRGPFRYAGSDSYTSVVRDIVDGYFPSEFQDENPDGVIINLVDKCHVDYVEGSSEIDRMTGFQLIKR